MNGIVIQHLAIRQDLIETVKRWFISEWPEYYGPGGSGDAESDLDKYAAVNTLPLGLVASLDGEPCGFAALKTDPFPSHPDLLPWAGAAYVRPSMRRKGIGRRLLLALEPESLALGHKKIYSATSTSASLLERCGWKLLENVTYENEIVGIYEKELKPESRLQNA